MDGHGTAFCTQALIDENTAHQLDENNLRKMLKEKIGVKRLVVLENTEPVGIQHIDCWLKVLDPERLLVKRAPSDHPEAAAIERNVVRLSGMTNAFNRPYKILRIDCPEIQVEKSYPEAKPIASYTNSLILNNKVLVPLFNVPGDKQAIETWKKALPGKKVKGFVWDKWLDYDALHCRTRAIFDIEKLQTDKSKLND